MALVRIALVTDWYPPAVGGVEVQVHGLARALAARGHDVRVFTSSRGGNGTDEAIVDRLACAHLPGTRLAVPTPRNYRWLRDRLAARPFDVLHAHGMFSTLAMGGLLAAKALSIPSVTTHHSLIRLHHLPFARLVYGLASGRADIVSAVSEPAAADARLASGREEVLTLPNGIDVNAADRSTARGAPDGEVRVTSVMRLKLKKRPYHLLWDFARVLKRVRNRSKVRFTVVGDGPERPRVERLAALLGIADRVEFCGSRSREEVDDILSRSSVFVSPVRAEAFGLALLEARVAGVPSVAMRGGGVAEVVEHGRHGLLPATHREFVDAIVRLVEDDELRRRLAAGTRQDIERFSWDRVVERHLEVYRAAIERHRSRATGGRQ